ncbi:ABC transporter ATP-binding protein [Shimazuella kribbensis]|uniref:ABC transporter ATP-binding protein n=1 Tax=Shimazuella kribbensis TaxID=139808 RepID=UPI0003FC94DF|nr:ABC transporter ATP-binding protein [Shimazuella kribbensis]
MNQKEIVLDVKGLDVQVHSNQGKLQVVQDLSFQIESGKVLGIVGESGCGKSITCLAILQLLDRVQYVTQGSIRLKELELTNRTEAQLQKIRGKEISLILQNPMNAFNPALTIEKQFLETIYAHSKLSRKQAHDQAVKSLDEMNLPNPKELLKQYPFELSGGMLQRVMIALSICMKPMLLLADEPTTALDSVNRHHVVEALQIIKKQEKTAILLVSHDLNVIHELADEVAVMKKGQFVETGSVAQLFSNPKHEYTKLLLDARLTTGTRNE